MSGAQLKQETRQEVCRQCRGVQRRAEVSLLYSNKYEETNIVSSLSQTDGKVFKRGFCLNCSCI